MARFVLDTGILVGYVRDAEYCRYVDARYRPLEAPNFAVISAVSKGEMLSLAVQFEWQQKKTQLLTEILAKLPALEIHRPAILQRYAEIDCYSKAKLPARPLPSGSSARKMGKNDLWIAATASVLEAPLLTTDGDFDHLDGIFLSVLRIDQKRTLADI
ncbi:MAG: type II toxin-antitoxin system VapC family toxin [Terrimicrobiaceae bacterium]|nr:type II toxin-antitoxin system VapC family toxin [Terrimicrobiaceae bacterium]